MNLTQWKKDFIKLANLMVRVMLKFLWDQTLFLKIKFIEEYCFVWSQLAHLQPCEDGYPSRVRNYIQYFDELNIEGFGFANGYRCSVVHKFEESSNSSSNMFETNFHQDQIKWKLNLIPIEISKNASDRVVDLLIYKNL